SSASRSFRSYIVFFTPKRPNHAMERTAGSFGSALTMKFHPQPAATRSPASRRSSCSQIGRASCREGVYISEVAVPIKKNTLESSERRAHFEVAFSPDYDRLY